MRLEKVLKWSKSLKNKSPKKRADVSEMVQKQVGMFNSPNTVPGSLSDPKMTPIDPKVV